MHPLGASAKFFCRFQPAKHIVAIHKVNHSVYHQKVTKKVEAHHENFIAFFGSFVGFHTNRM
jgi:hypothetical protein